MSLPFKIKTKLLAFVSGVEIFLRHHFMISYPMHETLEGWKAFYKQKKKQQPIRFWFFERFIPTLSRVVLFPVVVFLDVWYYTANRFIFGTHLLRSKLKRGQFHELDTRILHCVFEELINFVEIELASTLWDTKSRSKLFGRNPEAGLQSLKLQQTLVFDESWGIENNHPDYGKLMPQAIAAKEIEQLYMWWKFDFPKRIDPFDPKYRISAEKAFEFEKKFLEEEEEMLIRLIKIRRSLWT